MIPDNTRDHPEATAPRYRAASACAQKTNFWKFNWPPETQATRQDLVNIHAKTNREAFVLKSKQTTSPQRAQSRTENIKKKKYVYVYHDGAHPVSQGEYAPRRAALRMC